MAAGAKKRGKADLGPDGLWEPVVDAEGVLRRPKGSDRPRLLVEHLGAVNVGHQRGECLAPMGGGRPGVDMSRERFCCALARPGERYCEQHAHLTPERKPLASGKPPARVIGRNGRAGFGRGRARP